MKYRIDYSPLDGCYYVLIKKRKRQKWDYLRDNGCAIEYDTAEEAEKTIMNLENPPSDKVIKIFDFDVDGRLSITNIGGGELSREEKP